MTESSRNHLEEATCNHTAQPCRPANVPRMKHFLISCYAKMSGRSMLCFFGSPWVCLALSWRSAMQTRMFAGHCICHREALRAQSSGSQMLAISDLQPLQKCPAIFPFRLFAANPRPSQQLKFRPDSGTGIGTRRFWQVLPAALFNQQLH